jgi:hypothetical protein
MKMLSMKRPRPSIEIATPAAPAAPGANPTMAAPALAPEAPPLTLVGTIIGENSRIAIFFGEALKTATGEGESDAGWILRSVNPRSAMLDGSGRAVTLDLREPAARESPTPSDSETPRRRKLKSDNSCCYAACGCRRG